jgi:hypothetical protein
MDAKDQLDSLIETYNNLFQMCYDALAADAPQEQRDSIRKAINGFLNTSDTEE